MRACGFLLAAAALAATTPVPRVIEQGIYHALLKESDYYVLDAIAGHLHKPFAYRRYAWSEHPRGFIIARTNNLGFRNDRDTSAAKPAGTFRILVTGDSHTDGMVFNAESFPALLGASLDRRFGPGRFEVLNGGVGFYGPQNYLWFLEKFRYLKPDAFVVALYAGNDFVDAARYLEASSGASHPGRYLRKLSQAAREEEGPPWQALNQILYFKESPDMAERALSFTEDRFERIRDLCRRDGIRLVVVLLPTKLEVEWGSDQDVLDRMKAFFGLSDADLGLNARLRRRLGEWLGARGIPAWDPEAQMKAPGRALYWRFDYHLNPAGHELIARGLFGRYLEALTGRRP